jgi:hypothetical protein
MNGHTKTGYVRLSSVECLRAHGNEIHGELCDEHVTPVTQFGIVPTVARPLPVDHEVCPARVIGRLMIYPALLTDRVGCARRRAGQVLGLTKRDRLLAERAGHSHGVLGLLRTHDTFGRVVGL